MVPPLAAGAGRNQLPEEPRPWRLGRPNRRLPMDGPVPWLVPLVGRPSPPEGCKCSCMLKHRRMFHSQCLTALVLFHFNIPCSRPSPSRLSIHAGPTHWTTRSGWQCPEPWRTRSSRSQSCSGTLPLPCCPHCPRRCSRCAPAAAAPLRSAPAVAWKAAASWCAHGRARCCWLGRMPRCCPTPLQLLLLPVLPLRLPHLPRVGQEACRCQKQPQTLLLPAHWPRPPCTTPLTLALAGGCPACAAHHGALAPGPRLPATSQRWQGLRLPCTSCLQATGRCAERVSMQA